jgi:enamine deaminase RidA (YjgF/YER057c/UK114 family)
MPIDDRHSTGNAWERAYGYSRAVRAGPHVFVTGTLPLNPDGSPFTPDDGTAQATRALEIIEAAVRELGGSKLDIVRSRFFVTDIARSDEFGRAHAAFFADHRPALTMVEVAGLVGEGFLIEIEADAVLGE